jgi:thiol-disulfide isomerase/thioredoxin
MVKYAIAVLVLVAVATGSARSETVLLDFTSPHCGPCQQMLPTIENLIAAGYPIRKVDVTREPHIAQQYGVTQIPCFVLLVDGREADRVVGAVSGQQLQQMFPPAGRERTQSPEPAASAPQSPMGQDPWGPVNTGATVPIGGGDAPARMEVTPTAQEAQLIASCVRLKVEDAKGHSYGTGTIIDTRSGDALIITCGHLFRDSKGEGTVMVELFEVTPQGIRVIDQVPGHVVSYNVDREIGLVSIRPRSPVRVAPIAPTQTVMGRGDRVTSVGCNNGQDPTALATRVTATNRYQGPPNIEAQGAPVEGRSGGGLFNTTGELVGVCFAADYEGNEGLYTALESIHDELDRLGLTDVYQKSTPAAGQTAAQGPTAMPSVVRGQEPMPPVTPVSHDFEPQPTSIAMNPAPQGSAATPAGLNQVEQAAWDEIMARRVDSEVVCIIRPKQPGGKSEVITLDGVSPEFVRGLAEQSSAVPSMTR